MHWGSLEESNIYFDKNKLDGELWYKLPASAQLINSNVFSSLNYLYSNNDPQFDSQLNLDNKLLFNTIPLEIIEIVSESKIKINKTISNLLYNSKPLYSISNSDYESMVLNDIRKTKALNQAYLALTESGLFVFPSVEEFTMKFGLYEYAFELLFGSESTSIIDISEGIKRKKIDVLEWEYDKSFFNDFIKKSIPDSAMTFLSKYLNKNYESYSQFVGRTTFSF